MRKLRSMLRALANLGTNKGALWIDGRHTTSELHRQVRIRVKRSIMEWRAVGTGYKWASLGFECLAKHRHNHVAYGLRWHLQYGKFIDG